MFLTSPWYARRVYITLDQIPFKGNVVCQNYKRKSESNQLTVYEYKVRLKNFPFDKKIITKHYGKIEFVDISQTSHFENSVFVIT